ncbi:MAG: carbon-nitrogen hydrolase family protein, partial [Clostridia bacterium]|nr:carbon-nitrogen hydrolase family protein [Clostridia bacterium]
VAEIVDGNIEFNLSQMERFAKDSRRAGADLVCFGEAFLQGFNALSWQFDQDKNVAVATDSKIFSRIISLTKEIGIDILFGYNELDGEDIYSSCALIENGEIIHNYRRISIGWKESSKTDGHYKEENSVEVFDYKGKKCTIGLCGDLWDFPERFNLGEDVLFWPVYVGWTKEEWENGGKMEYAEQAKMCCPKTLYVNSICKEDAFGGAVFFVDGQIQRELAIYNEGILFVEI